MVVLSFTVLRDGISVYSGQSLSESEKKKDRIGKRKISKHLPPAPTAEVRIIVLL